MQSTQQPNTLPAKSTYEEWRPIPGFEGWYEASSLSRIRSVDRLIRKSDGTTSLYRGKVMSLKTGKMGYVRILFVKQGERFYEPAHRMIALAFIPNPYNKPFINHKNGIKDDNRIENLEWCTLSENVKHAYATGLFIHPKPMKGRSGKMNPVARPVTATHINGEVKSFETLKAAGDYTNNTSGNIHKNIHGLCGQLKGWNFQYATK
jgi:hypothetical protein